MNTNPLNILIPSANDINNNGTNDISCWKFYYSYGGEYGEYETTLYLNNTVEEAVIHVAKNIFEQFKVIVDEFEVLEGKGIGRRFTMLYNPICPPHQEKKKNDTMNNIIEKASSVQMRFDILNIHETQEYLLDYQFIYRSKTYKLSSKFLKYRCPELVKVNFSEILNDMNISIEVVDLFVHFLLQGSLSLENNQVKTITLVSIFNLLRLAEGFNMWELCDICNYLFDHLYCQKSKISIEENRYSRYIYNQHLYPRGYFTPVVKVTGGKSNAITEYIQQHEKNDYNLQTSSENILYNISMINIIEILGEVSSFIVMDEKSHRRKCQISGKVVIPVKPVYRFIFDTITSRIAHLGSLVQENCYKFADTLPLSLYMYIFAGNDFCYPKFLYKCYSGQPYGKMIKRIRKTPPVIINIPKTINSNADNTLPIELKKLDYDFIIYSRQDNNRGIAVHRWILSARWSWFSKMMAFSGIESLTGIVVLDEWCFNSIKYVLDYLYTNELGPMTFNIAKDILCHAEIFGLKHENDILITEAISAMNEFYPFIKYEENMEPLTL